MTHFTIDADVRATASHFGLDPALIQAVVIAEGDILKAVRCSIPSTPDRARALEITCRSAVHALSDFVTARSSVEFVEFWRDRWAPLGAANDPTSLNANWAANVRRIWATLSSRFAS